jgi:hypothetical protein
METTGGKPMRRRPTLAPLVIVILAAVFGSARGADAQVVWGGFGGFGWGPGWGVGAWPYGGWGLGVPAFGYGPAFGFGYGYPYFGYGGMWGGPWAAPWGGGFYGAGIPYAGGFFSPWWLTGYATVPPDSLAVGITPLAVRSLELERVLEGKPPLAATTLAPGRYRIEIRRVAEGSADAPP